MSKKEKYKGKTLSARGSRKMYIPIYVMMIVLVVAVIIIKYKGLSLNRIVFIAVIIFFLVGIKGTEVHRLKNKYEIIPPSLIHTEGYFSKRKRRVDLFAISDVDASQTFWQWLLGYGDVNVRLFSKESTTPIKNISSPNKFAEFLEQRMVEIRAGGVKNVPFS